MLSEGGKHIKTFMVESGLKEETANDFATLLSWKEGVAGIPESMVKRFRDLNILNKDDIIEMYEPTSSTEWILLGLTYEGLVKRQ